MDLILNESQYKRIFESDNVITKLNNMINSEIHEIKDNYVTVILDSIELVGNIESIDEVIVRISKVYYHKQDVTNFAINYVFFSEYDNESALSYKVKHRVETLLNKKYLKYVGIEVSEYDILIQLD
jgi:hypothetical protein